MAIQILMAMRNFISRVLFLDMAQFPFKKILILFLS